MKVVYSELSAQEVCHLRSSLLLEQSWLMSRGRRNRLSPPHQLWVNKSLSSPCFSHYYFFARCSSSLSTLQYVWHWLFFFVIKCQLFCFWLADQLAWTRPGGKVRMIATIPISACTGLNIAEIRDTACGFCFFFKGTWNISNSLAFWQNLLLQLVWILLFVRSNATEAGL